MPKHTPTPYADPGFFSGDSRQREFSFRTGPRPPHRRGRRSPTNQLSLFESDNSATDVRARLLTILFGFQLHSVPESANDDVPAPEILAEQPVTFSPILEEDAIGLVDIHEEIAPFLDDRGAVLPGMLTRMRAKLALFSQGELIVMENTDGSIMIDRLIPIRLPMETSVSEERQLIAELESVFHCEAKAPCLASIKFESLIELVEALFPGRFKVVFGMGEFQIQDKGYTDLPSSFSRHRDDD